MDFVALGQALVTALAAVFGVLAYFNITVSDEWLDAAKQRILGIAGALAAGAAALPPVWAALKSAMGLG
jgi:hypothetical protein